MGAPALSACPYIAYTGVGMCSCTSQGSHPAFTPAGQQQGRHRAALLLAVRRAPGPLLLLQQEGTGSPRHPPSAPAPPAPNLPWFSSPKSALRAPNPASCSLCLQERQRKYLSLSPWDKATLSMVSALRGGGKPFPAPGRDAEPAGVMLQSPKFEGALASSSFSIFPLLKWGFSGCFS